jgi:small subunit ribosomal protein S20
MPITSSAKKAVKVAKRRLGENTLSKLNYKQALKQVRKAADAGVEDMSGLLSTAQSTLDKAVKTKLMHRNTASRLLSRLNKRTSKVAAGQTIVKAVKKKATAKKITKTVKKSTKK